MEVLEVLYVRYVQATFSSTVYVDWSRFSSCLSFCRKGQAVIDERAGWQQHAVNDQGIKVKVYRPFRSSVLTTACSSVVFPSKSCKKPSPFKVTLFISHLAMVTNLGGKIPWVLFNQRTANFEAEPVCCVQPPSSYASGERERSAAGLAE